MGLQVDVRKLDLFNQMAKEGSGTVADNLGQLTGLNASVHTSQINFLDIADVKTHIGTEKRVGIFVELNEPPYGYVLFMLDPADSKRLAGAMMGGMGDPSEGSGFSDMEQSAMQEIGNIMTSAFIDGWANVLDTTIDMGTPNFVFGPASGIVDKMGGWPESELVFVIDSQITVEDGDLGMTVYTFPELESLVSLIQNIDLDTDVAADTNAGDVL
ncbi:MULTISPECIES: chemotaxis protein CheC [Haloarcula]|uniref:Chemotaxis protein n=1 Tax=Haloarcula pellucida TaxID=1427151 RepID=A0A830GRN9_9EURY|nr:MULTISPECIES: chemotaxis protein CheC [Halomicroarcula]MBX0349523.1 chemotaxis protein CheC [Halomicroarcula pellucida]MDS0278890.1 chemotaxis protein CheC [Halomicroarcula sp. S1AR25-4]GGO02515.1 chemotaxis protein [Halomicroarcula pellucida]